MKFLALAVVVGVGAVLVPLLLALIFTGFLLAAAFSVLLALVGAAFLAVRRVRSSAA